MSSGRTVLTVPGTATYSSKDRNQSHSQNASPRFTPVCTTYLRRCGIVCILSHGLLEREKEKVRGGGEGVGWGRRKREGMPRMVLQHARCIIIFQFFCLLFCRLQKWCCTPASPLALCFVGRARDQKASVLPLNLHSSSGDPVLLTGRQNLRMN